MSNNPATSVESWCFTTVVQVLKRMARKGLFRAIGSDNVKRVSEDSIIGRFNHRPSLDDKSQQTGERSIELPGFVVTYLGHTQPGASGDTCHNYGTVQILVQLVDSGDDGDMTNSESYLRWMRDVNEWVSRSPLERCPVRIGQIYEVHVAETSPQDETDWAFEENMRMALAVRCSTSTRITNYRRNA